MTSGPRWPGDGSPPSLTPVADALSALLDACRPVEPEEVAVTDAIGAILAEPLRPAGPIPPRSRALRRGWAVNAAEVVGASAYAPMPLPDAPASVEAGDPLPPGTDAVLPPDAVVVDGGLAQALAEAAPGALVRRAGEDAGAGVVLLAAGELLDARRAVLAELSGIATCRVRRPRLSVRHYGSDAGAGAARIVAAVARSAGVATEPPGASPPGRADALVLVGWPDDAAAALLDRPVARGLALRPGELTACGVRDGAPALVVPAEAADALAAALVLLRPVLSRLAGASPPPPRSRPLTRKISSTVGLTEVALLRDAPAGFEPIGVADLTVLALARAEFWLAVPPDSEGFAAGEIVTGVAV